MASGARRWCEAAGEVGATKNAKKKGGRPVRGRRARRQASEGENKEIEKRDGQDNKSDTDSWMFFVLFLFFTGDIKQESKVNQKGRLIV